MDSFFTTHVHSFFLFTAGAVFCACFFLIGFNRYTTTRVADLQRRATESEQRARELTEQYNERLSSIEANNERAKSIVDSMGKLMERNDGTIQGTREALQELRNYLEDLRTYYCSDNNGTSDMGDN